MKLKRLLFSGLLASLLLTLASGQNYPVSAIPGDLLKDAVLVVRRYDREIELQTVNSGTLRIHEVLTVLNKEGESLAPMVIFHNDNSRVKVNLVALYDKSGKKIRSIKQSEIGDSPAYSDAELYSSQRVTYYEPMGPEYPYTIEYLYEISEDNLLSLGRWNPQENYGVSVEKSQLRLSYPANLKINRKEVRVPAGSKKEIKGRIEETWELNNLKAIEDEPFSGSILERVPVLYLMPSVMRYDKFSGSSDDWRSYGAWVQKLYSGRDILPEEAIKKVNRTVSGIPDTIGKIKALYEFMQKNTRYVAITLGLGGYQPFDAGTVYKTGYGDCKALSNYMFSLLKVIGVKSYPALVSAGTHIENIFDDFPNFSQFDHVILCVPVSSDTIWLECTSQDMPFGFLGDFTDQREVLLITDNGGVMVRTPMYTESVNLWKGKASLALGSGLEAEGRIDINYYGLQYDDLATIFSLGTEDLKKWFYKNSILPGLQIKSIALSRRNEVLPEASLSVTLASANYLSPSGKYLVLPLNKINYQISVPKMLKPRQSEVIIDRSFHDVDTVCFTLPQGYKPESVPSPVIIESAFGRYSSSVIRSGAKIDFVRDFTLIQGRYKQEAYDKFYDFMLSVSKADNAKILLTR